MTEYLSEYLAAVNVSFSPSGKTEVWEIRSRRHDFPLGIVKWHFTWRKYAFFPDRETLYDPACLRDIAEFLEKLTTQHREARKHAAAPAS